MKDCHLEIKVDMLSRIEYAVWNSLHLLWIKGSHELSEWYQRGQISPCSQSRNPKSDHWVVVVEKYHDLKHVDFSSMQLYFLVLQFKVRFQVSLQSLCASVTVGNHHLIWINQLPSHCGGIASSESLGGIPYLALWTRWLSCFWRTFSKVFSLLLCNCLLFSMSSKISLSWGPSKTSVLSGISYWTIYGKNRSRGHLPWKTSQWVRLALYPFAHQASWWPPCDPMRRPLSREGFFYLRYRKRIEMESCSA